LGFFVCVCVFVAVLCKSGSPRLLLFGWGGEANECSTCGSDSSPSDSLKSSCAPNLSMAVSSSLLNGFELCTEAVVINDRGIFVIRVMLKSCP